MLRLSPNTVAIVKGTAPIFRTRGVEIARRTYQRLMSDDRAAAVFDITVFNQPERSLWFAALMAETIENIDNPEAFAHAAERMSERHLAEGITSAHYMWLAQVWPAAVRDVLGLGASDPMIDAWDETFWYLAGLLVEKQDELRYARTLRKVA